MVYSEDRKGSLIDEILSIQRSRSTNYSSYDKLTVYKFLDKFFVRIGIVALLLFGIYGVYKLDKMNKKIKEKCKL